MSHQDNYPDKLHSPTRDHHVQIKENKMNVYTENGYKSREDYLKSLAEDNGVTFQEVKTLSEALGPSEDFDALVTFVEDYAEGRREMYVPTDEDLKGMEREAELLDAQMRRAYPDDFKEPDNTKLNATIKDLREAGFDDAQIVRVVTKEGLLLPEG